MTLHSRDGGGLFGTISLTKTGGKIHSKIQITIWELRGQNLSTWMGAELCCENFPFSFIFSPCLTTLLKTRALIWAAANGGVTNGGLRVSGRPCWKSAKIGLLRPFPEGTALGKSRKRRKKAFFLRYSRIFLHSSRKMIAKLILKTLVHVTEMRFSKKIIPKQFSM